MTTQTRHPLTITYTVLVPDEVIEHITDSNGTRYWVEDDFIVTHDEWGTIYLRDRDGTRLAYDTESCLRGIALWIENGGDFNELLELNTDHTDHDLIWQYGFFGTLIYG